MATPGGWVTDCAVFDRILAPSEMPGFDGSIDYGYKIAAGTNVNSINISSGVTGRSPQVGDIGVIFVLVEEQLSGFTSGWTQSAVDLATFEFAYVYTKVLDGTETTVQDSTSNAGQNAFIFMCFDGSGFESAVADAPGGSAVGTQAAPSLAATGAASMFVQVAAVSGNVSLTNFTYSGAGWTIDLSPAFGANGTTPNPKVQVLAAIGGPGSSPALTWDPVGVNRRHRMAGIVIVP